METKRPWQIYALVIDYFLGISSVGNLLYYQVLYKKSILQICAIGSPILLLLLLTAALFIRRPWAYIMSIALLIPTYICGGLFMLVLFFIPSIWTFIVPILGIFTPYAILCSATRIYFKVKKEKPKKSETVVTTGRN